MTRRHGAALLTALAFAVPSAARAQADPGGAWRTLETAHFRVHFRPAYRAVGLVAANEAEAAWQGLDTLLPAPRGRIDLVVADNVDYANGLTSVYPLPTILVYAFPPPGDIQLADYDVWLRLVIRHELTHAFHLDASRGWWRVAQRIFGRVPGTFPNTYTPTWLTEGMAVFYESKLTGEGRLEGAFHRAVVDARVAEQGPLPMGSAGGISPAWPGGIRPYAFGATFFDWLTRRGGDTVMPRLVYQISRRPLPWLQLDGALKQAAGSSFTTAWHAWMNETAARLAGAGKPGPGEREVTVVCCQRTPNPPRLSADGRRLLLVRDDGSDAPELAVWDRDSARLRPLARVNSDEGATWSRGAAIVAQLEFGGPYTIRSDLYRVGADSVVQRLTRGARLREPDAAPSPDGRIVAVRTVPGSNELVVLRGDSTRVLVPARPGVEWATPRWNADGTELVAVRVEGGWHDIVLLDTTGAVTRQLTNDSAVDRTPVFTPGHSVMWAREVNGVSQLVIHDLLDGSEHQLTHAPFGAYAPAPAADSLFYLSYHADGFRLVATAWPREPAREDLVAADSSAHQAPAAPAVAETEHDYSPFPALLPHYWLPSLVQVGPGTLVGLFSTSQDPLGRHAWLADFGFGTGAAAGRWRGSFYYLFSGLPPAVVDVEAARDQNVFFYAQGGPAQCCLQEDRAAAGVTLLRRRWRSLASARLGAEYDGYELFERRTGVSLTGSYSNLVTAPLAISPLSGVRLSGRVRTRWRDDAPLQATDLLATAAGFTPGLKVGFASPVLAARVAAGTIVGGDTVVWGVGGLSGGTFELVPGVVVGEGSRSFPVRGYPSGWIEGRNAASASLEVRAPLALVGGGPPLFPPVTLDRLSALLFVDAGAAWSSRFCPAVGPPPGTVPATCSSSISSAGGELVVDAGVPYDFPVRIRTGLAWRFGLRSAAAYMTIGSSF